MYCPKCGKLKEKCLCAEKQFDKKYIIIAVVIVSIIIGGFCLLPSFFMVKRGDINTNYPENNPSINDKNDNINSENEDVNHNPGETENNQVNEPSSNENVTNENENNQSSESSDSSKTEFVMKCYKDTISGYEERYFYFVKNPEDENYYINRKVIRLTVPEGKNVDDYYVSEQIMNSGRYKMRLEGNVIVSEIDPSWAYWDEDEFIYKNISYLYMNKRFVEDGYACE